MNDQQINEAIAEACGWGEECVLNTDGNRVWVTNFPLYCTDLNAMAEAEKFLRDANLLFEYGMHISNSHHYEYLLRATARERAEAFLRTLGKWEEVQG